MNYMKSKHQSELHCQYAHIWSSTSVSVTVLDKLFPSL